jgi:hypothetical protein
MNSIKKTLVLLFFFALSLNLGALSLEEVLPGLPAEELQELRDKKEIVYYSETLPEFRYLPVTLLSDKVKKEFNGYEPNVCNEALFLMPLPDRNSDRALYIYNKLRAIRSLSGVQYHSNRHREMRVLFDDVYAVDGLRSKKKIPDKYLDVLQAEEKITVHIEDVNFGSGYYEASYMASGDLLAFGLKNLTSLKYIFPIIGAEMVRFQLLIIPLENELLMYGICAVEAASFVKSIIHLPSSFYTRTRALRDWFKGQVY